MSEQLKYVASKALQLSFGEDGHIFVHSTLSRPPQLLSQNGLLLLSCFAAAHTPDDVFSQLPAVLNMSRAEFDNFIKEFIADGLLVVRDEKNESVTVVPAPHVFAGMVSQMNMLRDNQRVLAYKAAITRHVKDKSVFEIGCGTGILSIFACKAGAASVTAVEESGICRLAEKMFAANDCAGKIKLHVANSKDVEPAAKADVIIHELIGDDVLEENILVYLDDARKRLLKPGGRMIPCRMEVCCIGYEEDHREQSLQEAAELAAMYEINVDPLLDELEAARTYPVAGGRPFSAAGIRLLTEELVLFDLDFYSGFEHVFEKKQLQLKAKKSGTVTGLLIYFRAHLDETLQLTNSPYAPSTHWLPHLQRLAAPVELAKGMTCAVQTWVANENGSHKVKVEPVS